MSGKIIMNLAVSLDGFISDLHGGFDWIIGQGDQSLDTLLQHDYAEFLNDIDVIVMGRNCYEQGFAKDYPTKKVYVATSHLKEVEDHVYFYDDIVERIKVEKSIGSKVFLFGGGILVDHFFKANMIDEYIIGIIPTLLGTGRPLFLGNSPMVNLHLDKYTLNDGIMVLHYSRR